MPWPGSGALGIHPAGAGSCPRPLPELGERQVGPRRPPAEVVEREEADVVLGSRLLVGNPVRQGMPWWKYFGNRFLTGLENLVFGLKLSEYHTGYRAYRREALESVNVEMNSDNFLFDQEIIAQ